MIVSALLRFVWSRLGFLSDSVSSAPLTSHSQAQAPSRLVCSAPLRAPSVSVSVSLHQDHVPRTVPREEKRSILNFRAHKGSKDGWCASALNRGRRTAGPMSRITADFALDAGTTSHRASSPRSIRSRTRVEPKGRQRPPGRRHHRTVRSCACRMKLGR